MKLKLLATTKAGFQLVKITQLLPPEICDLYVEEASQVAPRPAEVLGRERRVDTEFRMADLHHPENSLFPELQNIVTDLTGWGLKDQEQFSFLRYPEGGFVKNHNDCNVNLTRNRVGTLIVYLNDDFDGGETFFSKLDRVFTPRKGDAIFFNYDPALRKESRKMMHGGRRVENGEKWIVTAWMQGDGNGHIPLISEEKLQEYSA